VDIYGSIWGRWCSNAVIESSGVEVWKYIRRRWAEFCKFVRFDMGDGSKIIFCHDMWCGDQTSKAPFPELYSISRFKEALVVDHLQYSNDTLQWNDTFIRSVHDWEGG
jgi:hypothetical protein